MKKLSYPVVLCISIFILFVTAKPIHAVSIIVNDNGSVSMSEGQVLGDEIEKHEFKPDLKKTNDQKNEIKNIQPNEKKQIRVKNDERKSEVTIVKRPITDLKRIEKKVTVTNQEKIETKNVDIKLPIHKDGEITNKLSETVQNEHIKQVLKERQQRTDNVEIKTEPGTNDRQETHLEAGHVRAKLEAAEFVVDLSTNNVIITKPNGEQHTLLHLPDQALQQMEKAGLIDDTLPVNKDDLEIEARDNGTVVYKTKVSEKKHFLGFIPFQSEKEVVLDDESGLTSSKLTDNSFIHRWLLKLSK